MFSNIVCQTRCLFFSVNLGWRILYPEQNGNVSPAVRILVEAGFKSSGRMCQWDELCSFWLAVSSRACVSRNAYIIITCFVAWQYQEIKFVS